MVKKEEECVAGGGGRVCGVSGGGALEGCGGVDPEAKEEESAKEEEYGRGGEGKDGVEVEPEEGATGGCVCFTSTRTSSLSTTRLTA